ELALGIVDLDLEVAEDVPLLQVVGDGGGLLGVGGVELVAARELLEVGGNGHGGRARRQHDHLRVERLAGQLPQRRDVVDDVDAPPVGGEDEVRFAGMDGDIAHRYLGELAGEAGPAGAAV